MNLFLDIDDDVLMTRMKMIWMMTLLLTCSCCWSSILLHGCSLHSCPQQWLLYTPAV